AHAVSHALVGSRDIAPSLPLQNYSDSIRATIHRDSRRYVWRSRLPYRLQFTMETTRIEPRSRIDGVATGELEGTGCWQLTHAEGVTHVRYDCRVVANKWWMRRLAPIARPLFAGNHDVVMDWGRAGLLNRVRAGENNW